MHLAYCWTRSCVQAGEEESGEGVWAGRERCVCAIHVPGLIMELGKDFAVRERLSDTCETLVEKYNPLQSYSCCSAPKKNKIKVFKNDLPKTYHRASYMVAERSRENQIARRENMVKSMYSAHVIECNRLTTLLTRL